MRGTCLHLFGNMLNFEGITTWLHYRAVEVDKLSQLSLPLKAILMSDEDDNTIFLETVNGVFALQLESMEVNKARIRDRALSTMIAYRSFYIVGGSSAIDKDWTLLGKRTAEGDRVAAITWGVERA